MNSAVLAAYIAAGASLVTLAGTVISQRLSSRATSHDNEQTLDQLDRTLKEQRIRTLNERFATAAGQLGSDRPSAVRLAGVYAMAGLAEDWRENQQICVDVLCAYLRLPYEPDPGDDAPTERRLDFQASREVRRTVIRVICNHLRPDARVPWQGLNLDFTGVVFDGGNFAQAQFSGGIVRFNNACFVSDTVGFESVKFSGGTVDFGDAQFSGGRVNFSKAQFSGGTVLFTSAQFSGGTADFGDAQFSEGIVDFSKAQFSGGTVGFIRTQFSGGAVLFTSAQFSGGMVNFVLAQFSGGTVSFGPRILSPGAVFSGGTVNFTGAKFSGGEVDFSGAKFSGGEVDFSNAHVRPHLPSFDWDRPPPGVKLPTTVDGESP